MNFSALRDPQALRLFLAQLISQFGDKLMLIGVMWVVSASHSAEWAAWFIAVGTLPHLLLVKSAPRWIARLGALRTVIATDVIRGVCLLVAAPFVHPLAHLSAAQILILLFALNVLNNSLGALFNTAIFTLPTRITRDQDLVQRTTALIESCLSLSAAIAPALSVAGYAALGLPGLLAVNGLSYLVAAGIERGIRELPPENAEPESSSEKSEPSFRTLLNRDPLIPFLLLGFLAMNLFLGPLLAFIPLYVRHLYHEGLSSVALLETALGTGALIGSLAFAVLPSLRPTLTRIGSLLGLMSVAYLAFSVSGSPVSGGLTLLALGFTLAVANILILSLFQSRPLISEIPLVMSLVNLISVASLPLSMGATGLLLQAMGEARLREIGVTSAVCCLAIAPLFALVLKRTSLAQHIGEKEAA
jgi:hypothetical protein